MDPSLLAPAGCLLSPGGWGGEPVTRGAHTRRPKALLQGAARETRATLPWPGLRQTQLENAAGDLCSAAGGEMYLLCPANHSAAPQP